MPNLPQTSPESKPLKPKREGAFAANTLLTLSDSNAPRLNPELAAEIGLNESLVLLQLDFWIAISNNERDGQWWTYQSCQGMKDKAFPFWSIETIRCVVKTLVDRNLIFQRNHNKHKYDRKFWYAINFEAVARLEAVSVNASHPRVTQSNFTVLPSKSPFPESGNGLPKSGNGLPESGNALPENWEPIPESRTETRTECAPARADLIRKEESASSNAREMAAEPVNLLREMTGRMPNTIQPEQVLRTVTDIARWRLVIRQFMLEGQPTNKVDWLLECYQGGTNKKPVARGFVF